MKLKGKGVGNGKRDSAIFNNKGLGNFKVRPNHSMLKGMDAG